MSDVATNAWSDHLLVLFEMLRVDGFHDRVAVIREAALLGGYITRADVVGLIGRESLSNFTKPVKFRCDLLRKSGAVGPYAPDLLSAVYYGECSDPRVQRCVAFRVPFEAVEIVRALDTQTVRAADLGVSRRF